MRRGKRCLGMLLGKSFPGSIMYFTLQSCRVFKLGYPISSESSYHTKYNLVADYSGSKKNPI